MATKKKRKTDEISKPSEAWFKEIKVRMGIVEKFMKYIETHYVQADANGEANYLMGAAMGSIDFMSNALEELRKQEEQNHETI